VGRRWHLGRRLGRTAHGLLYDRAVMALTHGLEFTHHFTGDTTMLVIREVFTAKPGQATKLAKLFKRMADSTAMGGTVMTDVVGPYNTVVFERQLASLTDFEREMEEYRTGKVPDMDASLMEEMKNYTELWLTGRREVYRILE